ncbi:MAG: hypothetical protein M1830_003788, partial [Pleopsidium flavum]
MKILTTNFLTCALKTCKTSPLSYPLHFKDAELVQQELEYNPTFIVNILPRVDWDALKITAGELGFTTLPTTKPSPSPSTSTSAANALTPPASHPSNPTSPSYSLATPTPATSDEDEKLLHDLHTLLLETQVMSGKLVCGNCGHEYAIKEGIANFLLPNHL